MKLFFTTYLPWGIFAVTVVICFYQNLIDTNRRRDSQNPYDPTNTRQLEAFLILGTVLGALLCYAFIPIPVVWGVAVGSVFGLLLGYLKRKRNK